MIIVEGSTGRESFFAAWQDRTRKFLAGIAKVWHCRVIVLHDLTGAPESDVSRLKSRVRELTAEIGRLRSENKVSKRNCGRSNWC